MTKEDNLYISEFKNNVIAKKSKIFFYSLIDYFSLLVLSFIFLVGVANPITTVCSGYKDSVNGVAETVSTLNEIVSSTRLMRVDDDGDLEDISYLTTEYITALVKTSCYVHEIEYWYEIEGSDEYLRQVPSIEETFLYKYDEENDLDYPNDPLLYYYLVFKVENEELSSYVYNNEDRSTSSLDDFFYKQILAFNTSTMTDYFITNADYNNLDEYYQEELSRFNILNKRYAENLSLYLVFSDSTSTSTTTLYSYLSTYYQSATQYFIDEVEANYTPYIEARDNYNIYYSRFSLYNIYAMLSSYTLAFVILFVVVPIFLKSHRTIGQKLFKLGFTRVDEMEPTWKNILVYNVVIFILFFSNQLFSARFLGNYGVISFNLYGSMFSLFQVIIFALLVLILSYIFLAFNKNHQTISLLSSGMVVKQVDEFEAGIAKEDVMDDEGEIKEEIETVKKEENQIEDNKETQIEEVETIDEQQ